jgi:hypothetical protein
LSTIHHSFPDEFLALEGSVPPEFVRDLVETRTPNPVLEGLLSTVVSESPKVSARVWCGWWGMVVLTAARGGRLDAICVLRLSLWGGRHVLFLRRGGLSRDALCLLNGPTRTAGDDWTEVPQVAIRNLSQIDGVDVTLEPTRGAQEAGGAGKIRGLCRWSC